ncbi:alpha-glucosidase/alpha-galactosidase [Ohessyouella blattaphilus]|uniref:Alpha-glucosidase/alpha-galactosidase n=1 Tax=Ohessyouella blattaphilus TaxID=2949333 RepID=A0ABT1EFA3_9FIRM|nr:alpha-glucosidase/alpha-galactosidase [Ohessyouella blattaphilus]MCP1109385.1 alpha-glucosidase/alpha-galactosidase [Ohessyouella blattaphilus]MCR8562779.1 alpha-glucosidase/alpha-galactosidase [Ohessyouella blattaphilus]MDL2249310.1 alpha-glucosidase/alpha-galactosidase [Lachnospiraceae bacterium OttesenSCG-928-J05]
MIKITFIGAGSTVFARNVLGDCMCTPALRECEIALYDIDKNRLEDSEIILKAINKNINESRAEIKTYLGVENRKGALENADFVVNAIQVGGYSPSTIIDFEIPKKYGLNQTIADTLGIGGIMRALRTIPVLRDIAREMEEVCPDALFLNYTNPMSILTGYMQRYTKVRTVGLCHSVQKCTEELFTNLGIEEQLEGHTEYIAGINHMAWLLEIKDKTGKDLYPMIREMAKNKNAKEKHNDMVRFEYINNFGYYCTESSEHNAEYNNFFIKNRYPELIDKFNIPLDEYPRRCEKQIAEWEEEKAGILKNGEITHERSLEYASYIMEAIVTNKPYKIGGNVMNTGLITNLVEDACVEVPCLVDGSGINPCYVGALPTQLAAMNMTNINVQLLTIEAAVKKDRNYIYQAAMLDPHTSSELSVADIKKMCDELIEAHGEYMADYQ